jgi:peptide/nickel transport system permease protein
MSIEASERALAAQVRVLQETDPPSGRMARVRSFADVWVPGLILFAIVVSCYAWPLVYTLRSPTIGNLEFTNVTPFAKGYLLGSDPLGIDIVSRLLYGGRVSLEVGLGATGIGMFVGGIIGMVAGYKGGLLETVTMRILEMFLSFPPLVLALTITLCLGPSEVHVIWAIAFFSVPAFARLARAATLRLRERTFVIAARLSGSKDRAIILRHIAPNVFPQLMTVAFLFVGIAIIVEAALSFLGLGVPPPGPSWGNMIALGQQYLATDPYLVLIPAAALFLTVMSLNLLGDAVRARWGSR